ncbi:MAG: permease-like cell division protein FtsX [Lachnospiraceae bacterium]|nr:permease-like cell division protein FtsX [Lachnospiraceae bacterium]
MKVRAFLYSLKEGIKNIGRNRMFSLASIGTITACLFLFGIFYFILANFKSMIRTAETSVGITVFFDENASDVVKHEIRKNIDARPEVDHTVYISAEEAWNNYKETVLKKELADTFGDDNPLEGSDSFEVYLNDVERQTALVNYIKTLPGVRQVNSSDATASGIASFNSLVTYVSAAILLILLAVAVFLISTTVTMGIRVRSEEISIMRMVGATDYFIRSPFVVEGIIIGFLGSLIPLVVLYLLYGKIVEVISTKFNALINVLSFIPADQLFKSLTPVTLALGVGIGFFGSYITVRRHLNV